MSQKSISLPSELIERLEALAQAQGRTVAEVFDDMLAQYHASQSQGSQWAVQLAQNMAQAEIAWQENPDLSQHSQDDFADDAYQRWLKTQETTHNDD